MARFTLAQILKNLNQRLDQNRKVLSRQDLNELDGSAELNDGVQASEDLYYVLVEKTEGEAALRVQSGSPGDGMEAYQKVYLWFAGTTGLALSDAPRRPQA